jgi:PIN domain nuclease of toxin-antitoxin system
LGRWRLSLLLDTHALFWWVTKSSNLTEKANTAIADSTRQCFVSAATVYEMSNKVRLGKFEAANEIVDRLDEILADNNFTPLAISLEHAAVAGKLESPHRDPFDRILAAQAIVEGLKIVSADPAMKLLGVEVVW